TGFRHQYYLPSTSFPMNWVNGKYKEGYNVSSLTYGEGYWFVVVSKFTNKLRETYKTSSSFPSSFVSDEWNNNGMRVANMKFSYEEDLSVSFEEYYQAGIDAANNGDHDDAIFYYTEALKINNKHSTAYNNRAWSKYLIGQCQGGLADVNKSLQLERNEYNTHTRGAIYMCLGRCHEATVDYDASISLAEKEQGLYFADRGAARQCLGNYKKAIEDYDKAIRLDPVNASSYRSSKASCEKELAKNQKPKITWDYPYNSFTSTTKPSYDIKVCIHSAATITRKEVFINGQSFASRGFGVDDDCTASIEQSVNLKAGTNTIEVVVYTANNSARSEKRTIEYKAKSSGNYHALLIGVESYDDFSINDLEKPVADAKRLKSVLTSEYTFNESDIHLLQNPTKDEIINKLIYLQERLGKEDNLLIFYSGHGVAKDKLGYWLPKDAKKDSRSTWFSNGELRDYLYSMNTQHTLVVADACFGGTILTGGYRDITEFACNEMAKLPSCRAMTSGAGTIVPDESVFFKYFIKRLEDNDASCVSAETLYTKIKPAVIYNSPNNHIPQFGVLPQSGDEGGNFIFKKK
ncbi:MAG: caspase family protein, partial [Saprospiraceae bacterium]|nr:caspase family protein [Saprospiraceae bacterium]